MGRLSTLLVAVSGCLALAGHRVPQSQATSGGGLATFARLRADAPLSIACASAHFHPCVLRLQGGVSADFSEDFNEDAAARRLAEWAREDESGLSMVSDEGNEVDRNAAVRTSEEEEPSIEISSSVKMLNASSSMPDRISEGSSARSSDGAPAGPTSPALEGAREMTSFHSSGDDAVLERARRASVIQELLGMGADIRRAGR